MDKIEEIRRIANELELRTLDSFEYALYSTLTVDELCDLYFTYAGNAEIKNTLLKHIKSHIRHQNEKIPTKFKQKIISDFVNSSGRLRIAHGTTIKDFQQYFSVKQLTKFYYEQVSSEMISDRKRAFCVVERIFNEQVSDSLWNTWNCFKDPSAIDTWVKNAQASKIVHAFKHIWTNENVSLSTKNMALKIVAKTNFDSLSYLKETSPVSYLSACVSANKEVNDSYCSEVIGKVSNINQLGYVLWCLGMLGKYDFLKSEVNKISAIEQNLDKEWWEIALEDFT
ncbi:TPA: hypothetical protein NKV63_001716 [Vibrio parahaemolyticus]|nr:hypothetical protein [Vibrio parahaemolyticus]